MEDIFDAYRNNIAETDHRLAGLRKLINTNSLLRLATIVGGGAALFVAVQTESVWLVVGLFLLIVVGFMALVWRQSKLEAQKAACEDFRAVNQNELAMADGNPNLYPDGATYMDGKHPYSGDLDIFGTSSVFALVNRCATPAANRLLATWLSAPADRDAIVARQAVVGELATDTAWCQQFQADLLFNVAQRTDFKQQFARFLKGGDTLESAFLRGYIKIVPWLMVLVVGLAVFWPVAIPIAVFLALAHLLAAMAYGGKIGRIAGQVDRAGRTLGAFAKSFEQIESRHWQSGRGQALVASLRARGGDKPVSAIFRELATLIDRLDHRLNMLVGGVLNMAALWDFKQVFAVLDWRKQYGNQVLGALDVVAELEVLVSLATLRRNHPKWVFPEILASAQPFVAAAGLSHPLIAPHTAVPNDYAMDDHRVALITGSNMAGKSTFLRVVGTNAVLALCGAPVCGTSMRLSVFHVVSYMRIADSLNESTSTFKAELNRIEGVLRAVRTQADTFFLIDEMLRGTNSKDKYLGSKAIIERLIADGGVGMVATHDLQLAKLADDYPGKLANFHFDIQVRTGEMLFDYKLKPGECTIFNASILLKNIGIDVAAG
ncbi:MutS-related protein [Parapedobacter sp. 10938]|uniref:MutS-related protein n=1 Tax=Parapedobacter flavus TaxID=3110225 RepID=UPI002DB6FC8F|nr:DNA mismatch repair protein MutS [Parapedobacter sp. 10938]MEC3879050.1 DNA mismatch repair protein MutS [Parapedobacter sp. 10938]